MCSRKLEALILQGLRNFQNYSDGGRPTEHQAQLFRSLVLFVLLFNKTKAGTSLTSWVREVLPASISLTVLISCSSTDELPPHGSYYDLMNRFWQGDRYVYSRSSLLPASRNGKKPEKVIGSDGKLSAPHDAASTTTRDIVDNIMEGKPVSGNTQETLQKIFSILAVLPSLQAGLFDATDLTVSDDGMAVASHSSPYGRHLSSCNRSCPFRSTCGRHYSDPDAGRGWDSVNETCFFGHTLYMLCCRNGKLKVELPLLMNFTDARRHDSKNFLYAIDSFGRNGCGLSPKNICLDSAHDNILTYKILEHWGINALIDINGRSKSSVGATDDITFNEEGHPLCRAGHEMCSWGNDPIKDAHKYRCLLRCGRIGKCPHEAECSPGRYGRTVYIEIIGTNCSCYLYGSEIDTFFFQNRGKYLFYHTSLPRFS